MTVTQSNYGTCLPVIDACHSLTDGVFGNYSLYDAMRKNGVECTGLIHKSTLSGVVVSSSSMPCAGGVVVVVVVAIAAATTVGSFLDCILN